MSGAEMTELHRVQPPVFNYDEESPSEKLTRKSKESPFVIIGLVGLVTACGVGAYKFKRRGTMSISLFLMQLRVVAQGTVVGALTAGIAYQMFNHYILHNDSEKKEE